MLAREVLTHVAGAAGFITLNRPTALNALTHGMVLDIARALDGFEANTSVKTIVIEGSGEKAFCAGGDIRSLYASLKAGDFAGPLQFWADEYRLNQRIKRTLKPFVALVDGIVMGGGAGVSINGSHVVAGDKFSFAMPEVGIGFFPDVGATHFLSHLPGPWGKYLALTGARVDGDLALGLGLVKARIASRDFPALKAALVAGTPADEAISPFCLPTSVNQKLTPTWMSECFEPDQIGKILQLLDHHTQPAACAAAKLIGQKSPTSLHIALRQMNIGRHITFEQALQIEFQIVARILAMPDFAEGIRAAVIDKDFSPSWHPALLEEVTEMEIDRYFAPLEPGDQLFARGEPSSGH